jgi:acyl carrier protein
MDNKLAKIFKSLFGVEEFTEELSVESVNKWDSINHLSLVMEIEKEFGVEFSVVESINMSCVKEIKKLLAEKS